MNLYYKSLTALLAAAWEEAVLIAAADRIYNTATKV